MASNFLVLEDGTVLEGESFGYEGTSYGEVVFSTGMGGYQEGLTDPSFRGQILMFTFPLIGNYGVRKEFEQSDDVHVRGVVVREYCKQPSKMYGGAPLDEYLKEHKIPAISGIDTREIVVRIRKNGILKGAIVKSKEEVDKVLEELKTMPYPYTSNLVAEVSTKEIIAYNNKKNMTIGLIDCGTKSGIIKELCKRSNVKVFPYDTPAKTIMDSGVYGVLISNGPGDPSHPAVMDTTVRTVRELSGVMPMMGICYGSHIIALAMGGRTYKMSFGHRGENHPVKYEGKVYITSQNHGFAVDSSSLEGTGMIVDQVNVNDGTVEGLRHKDLPIFTCQYHPEASPGPDDTSFLFEKFIDMIEGAKR